MPGNRTLLEMQINYEESPTGSIQLLRKLFARRGVVMNGGDLKINLRLILVSGKTKEFVFSPVDSAGDIAIHGRFLHSSVTLGALGLQLGRTTVMHLVPREHLPEPNSH
ncbi:hypothetical protein MSG28_009301, partial [Choristoneura fumiferana]